MYMLRRSPVGIAISAIVVLAVVAFVIFRVANKVSDTANSIGSDSSTGGGDSDSLYRPANFSTALKAVKAKVGPSGDILEIRIEAKKADFTVREGKSEKATGWRAKAGDGGDLSSFGVDVVGQGSLANSAIPASDVTADAIGRMQAQALKRDPGAKPSTIAFFTLEVDPGTSKPQWDMNVDGHLYQAGLNGTGLHSPGDGAGRPATPATPATPGTPATPAVPTTPNLPPEAQRGIKLANCVSAAAGDIAKIQRCQKTFAP